MIGPFSAEMTLAEACERGDIEVVGSGDVAASLEIFLDNSKADLEDLVFLCCSLDIIIILLQSQLASTCRPA